MDQKAVFLDKDGTLIPDIPYNTVIEKITLSENAAEGLMRLSEKGYQFYIVTNQPGIALGYLTERDLVAVRQKISDLLANLSIRLSGFYFCPHDDTRECSCRKPLPGLIITAARQHHINLKDSWMIGDILNDVEAGNRAGCRTILVNNGSETEWLDGEFRKPERVVSNLNEAADFILMNEMNNI